MKRLLVVVTPLVLSTACAPRYDLFLSWTIDGQEAASACKMFNKPGIEVHAAQRDTEDGAALDEHFDLACEEGAGSIAVASFADVNLDLLSKDAVWGMSGTASTSAGAQDTYDGQTADNPLAFDITVTKSRIQARLTAVGESCGDAGVDAFTVGLAKNASPLNNEAIDLDKDSDADTIDIACEDGEAYFTYGPVDVGATYVISATAVLDLATDGNGTAFKATPGLTEVTVDLVRTE